MNTNTKIYLSDIMDMSEYGKQRASIRKKIRLRKRNRRVSVGPFATFYFENYDTMWIQIHEMLYVERGGDEQIADELDAYNPLIPQGRELIATLMLEIADPQQRARELTKLGGIENTCKIEIGSITVDGKPLKDNVERTTTDGKTSAVHFIRFNFTETEIMHFCDQSIKGLISINHSNYGHMAVIPENVRGALKHDFHNKK